MSRLPSQSRLYLRYEAAVSQVYILARLPSMAFTRMEPHSVDSHYKHSKISKFAFGDDGTPNDPTPLQYHVQRVSTIRIRGYSRQSISHRAFLP